jgi:hypothetical protein
MKLSAITSLLLLSASCCTHAFVAQPTTTAFVQKSSSSTTTQCQMAEVFDQEQFIAESKEMRLKHLEEQAMFALKIAVENYGE